MVGLLVVIAGPSSGGGKDSVTRGVQAKGEFARIITYNTRDIRPGEKQGVDYHFISKEEFLQKKSAGFFLETNQYRDNFYGTPREAVLQALKKGADVLLRVDVNGARAVKEQLPKTVTIFVYAPIPAMRSRLIKRGRDSREEIEKKLALARKEMREKDKNYFDYRILNREAKLEETIGQVLKIIEREKRLDPEMNSG